MKRRQGQRLLGSGYAQALRLFVDSPRAWHDLAGAMGIERMAANAICHGLHRQGLVHIQRWDRRPVGHRTQWTAVYAFGAGVDAEPGVKLRRSTTRTRSELLAFCDLVKALQANSWHFNALADHVGQSQRAVRSTVKTMHQLRLVFIDEYAQRPIGGYGYPLYTWGIDQKDAVKPKPIPKPVLATKWNAIRSARKRQAKILHGLVHGVSLDGRRRARNDEVVAAA